MREKGKRFITKYGFRLFVFAFLTVVFMLLGRDGPVLFDDSGSYMRIRWHEGVMPAYPILLLLNQYFFGDIWYLWAVILEQALLAAFSVTVFEETLRKRFGLLPVEGVLICLFALYPYTIEMPVVMTQAILTEGIAYSIFYLFLAVLLSAVWDKSYIRLAGAFGITLLLSAVRSQLQILFAVCGIVFFYLVCMGKKTAGKGRKIIRAAAGLLGCMAVSLAGVVLVLGLIRGYRVMLGPEHPFNRFGLKVQWPEVYQIALEEDRQKAAAQEAAGTELDAQAAESEGQAETVNEEALSAAETEEALVDKSFTTSQYMTLIFSRGMYEADYEDAALFQDPVVKGLFLALYEETDREQERYAYAREGLWMWKDIVGGIGKIGGTCLFTPSEYYVEYAPEVIRSEQFSEIRSSHLRTIGFTLIRAHFGRFLYHTLMLLPQAFISTVFFQFAPLYGFCHLVTAFLYLAALSLMVWGYADVRARREGAEMMALVLGSNVVTVLVISLVFFGQQRYLVYAFGMFYIAYYVLLRKLWNLYIRGRLSELWKRRSAFGKALQKKKDR